MGPFLLRAGSCGVVGTLGAADAMSLKAKIEAVIYASEEPVTPQQLAGLLGQEAQAELDLAEARQGQLALDATETVVVVQEVEAGDPDVLNAETLGPEVFAAVAPAEDATAGQTDGPDVRDAPDGEAGGEAGVFAETSTGAAEGEGSGTDRAAVERVPGEIGEPTPAEARARERRLREYLRGVLDELVAEYANGDRGLEIREVAGGFRFATKPEYHDAVRGFVRSLKPPLKLSLQALETLAVVAYKQPVTAPEVSEVRGVESAGTLGGLIARKLVTTAGRKQVIGRPILYKTTKEFLLRFGLRDLQELPSIEEFERMASELNEAVQEEIPMAAEHLDEIRPSGVAGDAARAVEPMRDEHAAQADGVPDESSDAEGLTPAEQGPGEFTGDETVQPADNVEVDGRESGVPPRYDQPEAGVDSPALDAEVQGDEQEESAGATTNE